MRQDISKEVKILENVNVDIQGTKIVATGALGKVERDFPYDFISMEKKDNTIIISSKKATKKEKKITGSIAAHINNMIQGVANGFEYKLQICSVHFPISTNIDSQKKTLTIKNFLGESKERKAVLLPNVEVKIQGDIITIKSADKEAASHTAANIEMATKIRSRDRRVFQDGIFMIEKAGSKI